MCDCRDRICNTCATRVGELSGAGLQWVRVTGVCVVLLASPLLAGRPRRRLFVRQTSFPKSLRSLNACINGKTKPIGRRTQFVLFSNAR